MIWRRSQKVVCISGGTWGPAKGFVFKGGEIPQPVKGAVYTIWDIVRYPELPDFVGLSLVEIPGFGCDAKAFRPAVDRPTDISVFTKALLPTTPNLEPVS